MLVRLESDVVPRFCLPVDVVADLGLAHFRYRRMREPNSNVMSKLTEDHNYVRGVIHDLRTQLCVMSH